MWFSNTIFKASSLIISKIKLLNFLSFWGFFFKADFPAWFKHYRKSSLVTALALSHSLKFRERLILLGSSSCVPRSCPKTKDFARLLSALLPLDGTKAQGKSWAVRWGWGRSASLQNAGILPPRPAASRTLPAHEDIGEQPEYPEYLSFRSTAEQPGWPLSAFLQDSTCAKSLLN